MRNNVACWFAMSAVLLAVGTDAGAQPAIEDWERSVGRVFCRMSGGIGTGSGFLVDEEGHLVTNAHVVDGCRDLEVTFSGRDHDPQVARLVFSDSGKDIAVVNIGATSRDPLPVFDRKVDKGTAVFVLGYPGSADISKEAAFEVSVTNGIVAKYTEDADGRRVIQTDAKIGHGNSGGPMLDECGRVVGIAAFGTGEVTDKSDFAIAAAELTDLLGRHGIDFRRDADACESNASTTDRRDDEIQETSRHTPAQGESGGSTATIVIASATAAATLLLVGVFFGWIRPRAASRKAGAPGGGSPLGSPSQPSAGSPHPAAATTLVGVAGPHANSRIPLGERPIVIGRDPQQAQVVIPPNTKGVSRTHLEVVLRRGVVSIRDMGSSGGTTVDGRRVQPNQWVPVRPGQTIGLGGRHVKFVVR